MDKHDLASLLEVLRNIVGSIDELTEVVKLLVNEELDDGGSEDD